MEPACPFQELLRRGYAALTVYSNVHRGTGQFSIASTALYERARDEVLRYAGLSSHKYEAVFVNPSRMALLENAFSGDVAFCIQSGDLGLQMGIGALVFRKGKLKRMKPQDTGGGMVKLVNQTFVIFSDGAERFETGTPPIMNAILLGIALQMVRESDDPQLFQSKKDNLDWLAVLAVKDHRRGSAFLEALQQEHIGRDVAVPVVGGMKTYVNFDGAASTPSFEPIWQSFCDALQLSEPDQMSLVAEVLLRMRGFFGAPSDEFDFVFACNTSEAVNYAVRNLAEKEFGEIEPVVVNTLLEHHSNELPWRFHPEFSLVQSPIDTNGFVDLPALEALLRSYNENHDFGRQRVVLFAISGASNVLGTLNPLAAISELCHRYNVEVIVDAAQLSAHRKVDLMALGVDYYAFSAHKMYSPFGSGGLFLRRQSHFLKEEICVNGFANAAGIAALGKSIGLLQQIGFDEIEAYERELTKRALDVLHRFDRVQVYGVEDTASPQFADRGSVIVFEMRGISHNLLAKYLADFGAIGTRNGCFCAHMLVIELMKIKAWRSKAAKIILDLKGNWFLPILPGLVRISFGIENTIEDIDNFEAALTMVNQIKLGPINRWLASVHEGTFILPKSGVERQVSDFVQQQMGKVFP